jgi:hypothetical protein
MYYLVVVMVSIWGIRMHPYIFTVYASSPKQAYDLALSDLTDPNTEIERVRVFSTSLSKPVEEVV